MITIYFAGHSSHFDGKYTEAELQAGLEFIGARFPRPPFSRSRILVKREPGPLNCTVDDEKPLSNPKVSDKITSGLLQSDLAYCEEWRLSRLREMEDFMVSRRYSDALLKAAPPPEKG